jgi:hypothetical protein
LVRNWAGFRADSYRTFLSSTKAEPKGSRFGCYYCPSFLDLFQELSNRYSLASIPEDIQYPSHWSDVFPCMPCSRSASTAPLRSGKKAAGYFLPFATWYLILSGAIPRTYKLSCPLLQFVMWRYWFRLSRYVYGGNRSFAPILSQSRWSLLYDVYWLVLMMVCRCTWTGTTGTGSKYLNTSSGSKILFFSFEQQNKEWMKTTSRTKNEINEQQQRRNEHNK